MKVSLLEISDFITDGTHGSPERAESGIPVLSAQNVKDGRISYETSRFTTENEYLAFNRRLAIRPGDVLLTIVGSIGRAAVVRESRPAVFQRSVAAIRPKSDKADPRYLLHLFHSPSFQRELIKNSNQSSQAGVYLGRLGSIEIPLPPLEEQRRIAAVLDKASLLGARSSEGAELIEFLGVERLEQLVALNETGLASHKLEYLCDSGAPITYGILQPGPDLDDGIPYVRPSEIKDSRIEVSKLRKTSSEIARKYQKSVLRAGDILLTIVGTIGEVAIVPPEIEGANITQSSCRIRIDSRSANPVYVYHYLKSKHVRRQIERDRLGVAVERLNLHHVRDMEILLLPREVQERFAAEVISLESVAFRWSALANRASALSASLQHYFFGAK